MHQKILAMLAIFFLLTGSLACSISSLRQQVSSAQQTASSVRTKVSGVITAGGSLVDTAQAFETQHSGIIKTVKAFATRNAPLLSTVQAVVTDKPGLVETAQAMLKGEIPAGDPPPDIPIFNQDQADSFFGSSQYIFYITQSDYTQVLAFYQIEMPNNGWQYAPSDSHEYPHAAQLNFSKDTRTATVDISFNSLNHTTLVIINILG